MPLKNKIEYLMKMKCISAQELATTIAIDRSTLIRILNGTTTSPRPETLQSLANYFNISITELLDEENPNRFNVKNTKLQDILHTLMQTTVLISTVLLNKYSGVPVSVLRELLNGKTEMPNIKTLHKLANLFNLTVPQLLGEEPISERYVVKLNTANRSVKLYSLADLQNNNSNFKCELIYVRQELMTDKAFALKIEDQTLEPDFRVGSILLIDQLQFTSGDFILLKVEASITIYEFMKNGDKGYMRMAGTRNWQETSIDNMEILGVVIQQILTLKK